MKYIWMKHRHNPPHSYGDCLRACVASVLEAEDAPHFYLDGPDEATARERLDDYLSTERALTTWLCGYAGGPLQDLLDGIGSDNPGRNYILFGAIATGEPHAVVCRDNAQVHDPSPWPTGGIVGPYEGNYAVLFFIPEVTRYA